MKRTNFLRNIKVALAMSLLIPNPCISEEFGDSILQEYLQLESNNTPPISINIQYYKAMNIAIEEYCEFARQQSKKYPKVNPSDCKDNSDIILIDGKDDGYWVIIRTNKYNTTSGGMYLIHKEKFSILEKDYFM